jgi:hypothetical protein
METSPPSRQAPGMITSLIHTTKTACALALIALAAAAAAAVPAAASITAPPCRTADLSARLGRVDAGAGQRYETLTLTNVSRHTCHTYGYVGMLFLDARGRALPTQVLRDRTHRPRRVLLAPGARASTQLHWSAIPGSSDVNGRCGPAPRGVEVAPPDETTHLIIRWTGGAVCEHGQVSVTRLI